MAITGRRGIRASGVLGLLLGASVANAQIPDKFTNLQVLPKDVPAARRAQGPLR